MKLGAFRSPPAGPHRSVGLEPAIERVLARKPASDHPPLDPDYVIPPYPRQTDDDETGKLHRWLDEYRERIVRGEDVSKRLA